MRSPCHIGAALVKNKQWLIIERLLSSAARKAEWAWEHMAEAYRERESTRAGALEAVPSHLSAYTMSERTSSSSVYIRRQVSLHGPSLTICTTLEQTPNDWDKHKTAERLARLEAL